MIFSQYMRYMCGVVLMICLVLGSQPAMGSGMAGMDTSSNRDEDKGNMPPDIERILDTLFYDVASHETKPDRQTVLPLIQYVHSDIQPKKVRPHKREHGAGIFMRIQLNIPLDQVLRYCYNPAIPGEALYPSVLRRSYWLPESEMVKNTTPLWDILPTLTDTSPLVYVRGAEFEEITPDAFSGCYYSYILDRLLILLRYEGRGMLVSVTRQQKPSTVGRVGAIVGKDTNWDYVYSNVVGSNIALARWAETFMYDSANVTVFSQTSPGARTTQLAFFKYVRAGWAHMNMVKPSHIAKGSERYIEGMRQVLESSTLPQPDDISKKMNMLRTMDTASLQAALTPYSTALATYTNSGDLSSKNFKNLLHNNGYATSLTPEALQSELIKQYIKNALGKPALASKTN